MHDAITTIRPPEIVEHLDGTLEITLDPLPIHRGSAATRQLRVQAGADFLNVDIRFRRAGQEPTPWLVLERTGPEWFGGQVPLPIPRSVRHLTVLMIWADEERERQSLMS